MLQLKLNSFYLDVPDNIEIPFTSTNPLFSESGFNEAFTYQFTLLATPRNSTVYNDLVRKNPTLTIIFCGHTFFVGKVEMKKDSGGISIMAKNDGLDLRQLLESTDFSSITWPKYSIWENSDDAPTKIAKWKAFMDATLPQNEAVNSGAIKFPPIQAYPRVQWAKEEKNGRDLNYLMDVNGWTLNRYDLENGTYAQNEFVDLPVQEITFLKVYDATTLSGGEYFTINSANDERKYYVWYQKMFGPTPIGVDPAVSGRIGIKVKTATTSSAEQVMIDTISYMMQATEDFEFVNFGLTDPSEIFIRNVKGGQTENALDVTLPTSWSLNPYQEGTGLISDYNNNWSQSVSPCPRFQYMLKNILSELKIYVSKNDLETIQEFCELVYYSGKCLDERLDEDNKQYNVHGQELNVADFVPSGTVLELFTTLRNLFGVSFDYLNGKLRIERINLNAQTKNVSKFCAPQYQETPQQITAWKYTYGLTDTSDYVDTVNDETVNRYASRQIASNKTVTEIKVGFVPMVSQNQKPTSFHVPELAKSNSNNNEDWLNSSNFWIGLYRGNRLLEYQLPFSTTVNEEERLVCFSSNTIEPNDTNYINGSINYSGDLGKCSIYLDDEDSHFDLFTKELIKVNRYSTEIKKVLQFPFAEILDLMQWKNSVHCIQQRNLSFIGIAKELTFTLSKNSISPTTVTYMVNNRDKSKDFNVDFNNDFR